MSVLGGCVPDLGEPNESAAREVVFYYAPGDPNSGLPLYAGQALTVQYCANGICHDVSATGVSRRLAPAGLDFSVNTPCEAESASDTSCQTSTETLRRGRASIFDHARRAYAEVLDETMPPAGERREETPVYFRTYDNVAGGSDPLPDILSEEGKEIFRVWLATGAPVIQHAPTRSGLAPGQECDVAEVGECAGRGEPPVPPDPDWPSIYEVFAGDTCVTGCHVPGSELFEDSNLDLSTEQLAYDGLVGVLAQGDCADGTLVLVVPSNADASVLIQKMEEEEPACGGDQMPQGRTPFPESFIDPIREWIAAGAPRMPE